nr:DUF4091 domain-containing protein [Clostridia bacterium]
FYTPKTLPAGLYSGKVTVETPQKEEIECFIEVLDIALTDEVTHKAYFNVSIGEVFSSFEGEEGRDKHGPVAEKYYEFVLKHRISPSTHFIKRGTENLTQAEQFAENYFYSVFEKNQPLMGLPCIPKAGVKKRFDETVLRDTLKAVTEKCLNEQKNIFPRLCFYNWVIDEPFCWVDDTGAVAWSIRTFNEIKKEVFDCYLKDERAKTKIGQEILSSLLDVQQVVTDYVERKDYTPYQANFQEDGKTKYYYNPKEVTLCPKFDGLESAKKRKKYEGAKELWWYGCGNPASPWASYHVDDCGFSPRLLAWMMQQYGVVGNLFWDMTFETEWLVGDDGKVYSQTVKDPYAVRRVGSNSDGTLLYPAKPYGVEEPIGGLRLKSIRDGYEDYELIALLKEEYQKRGKSADGIFARLTSPVYFDAKLDSFSETFDIVKEGFYRALELVCSFGITMQAEFENGETSIVIEGADGVSSDLGKVDKTENGFLFTAKRSVDFATLSIRKGEEERKFPVYVGEGLFV